MTQTPIEVVPIDWRKEAVTAFIRLPVVGLFALFFVGSYMIIDKWLDLYDNQQAAQIEMLSQCIKTMP